MSHAPTLQRTAQIAAALLLAASPAAAQTPATPEPESAAHPIEFRLPSGSFLPMGDGRRALKDAQSSAAQLSWRVRPALAVTSTFAWARSRDLARANAPKLDVLTLDVGIEQRVGAWCTDCRVSFDAFTGLGAGARRYDHRALDTDAATAFAAYGSVGGEVGMGRFGLRVELRSYATASRAQAVGPSSTSSDAVITAALRFNRHR